MSEGEEHDRETFTGAYIPDGGRPEVPTVAESIRKDGSRLPDNDDL